jgi:hypothetical protein
MLFVDGHRSVASDESRQWIFIEGLSRRSSSVFSRHTFNRRAGWYLRVFARMVSLILKYRRASPTTPTKAATDSNPPNRGRLAGPSDRHASGARTDQPGLIEALSYVRHGDVLVCGSSIGSTARCRISLRPSPT